MKLAKLRIFVLDGKRYLVGHDDDELAVFVIKKSHTWELHKVEIDDKEATLRAFLTAEQSTTGELTHAISKVITPTSKKPRRSRKKT